MKNDDDDSMMITVNVTTNDNDVPGILSKLAKGHTGILAHSGMLRGKL